MPLTVSSADWTYSRIELVSLQIYQLTFPKLKCKAKKQ